VYGLGINHASTTSTRFMRKTDVASVRCAQELLNTNWRKQMRILFTIVTVTCLSEAVASAADAKAGQAVYQKSCQSCHGPDGSANPAIAKMFKVDIQDLKSSEVQAMSDDDIKKIITDGKGKMKPVTSVSGTALDNVVAYVRSLKK
jgi:predicted CXXCH cytochrome family protein